MAKNVQASLEKWKRNIATSGDSVKSGVNQMSESPGVKAAAAKDKYLRRVQESANDGTYEAGQLSYTLQEYKDAVVGKGISNMMTGASKISARSQRAMTDNFAHANQVSDQVAGMPTGTLEEGIAKSAAAIRLMAEGRRNRRR